MEGRRWPRSFCTAVALREAGICSGPGPGLPRAEWTLNNSFSDLAAAALFCSPLSRYFAAPGASTRGAMLRSVRHAAGPALGTLCFGAAVTTLAHIVRSMAEK